MLVCATHGLQGVSILARRLQPGHVLAFLVALWEIMQGAGACADAALREMSDVAAATQARWRERQQKREQAAAAAAAAGDSAAGQSGAGISPGEVREYFLRLQREREGGGVLGGDEGGGEAQRVGMDGEQRAALALVKRRAHAAASLAQTAVDCCGPLALSSSLQVGG
jgi:hypothetical protein